MWSHGLGLKAARRFFVSLSISRPSPYLEQILTNSCWLIGCRSLFDAC